MTADKELFREIFNAIPLPIFRVTKEVEILDLNRAARRLFQVEPTEARKKRGGDVLHCINAVGRAEGCGFAPPCATCLIRNSVWEAFESGREISRRRVAAEVVDNGRSAPMDLLITVTPFDHAGETSVLLCLEDITELTSLRAMIPICSSCKNIRDDQELWSSVEYYFSRFMGVDFTHGICPDCARRLYPDLFPPSRE